MRNRKIFLLSVFFLFAKYVVQGQTVNLLITVNNVKSNIGILKVCVFNEAKGFPEKTDLAVKCLNINAIKGTLQVKIDGVTPGKYALSAYHDENNDGEFNTNLLGIPKEAAGASNGAHGKMGPPKFENAVIMIDKNKTQISIVLH
jgi:uncharacterized protein (DUF2141 family)